MTTISKNMKLADLRSVSFFAGCTEAELKVVRTCLVMTQDGVALSAASPADLEMVRAHAVASESGAGVLSVASVEARFARSSIQFLHWNRRTAEWFLGIGTPPLASDGKRGGWIFFEIKADSAEEAKALEAAGCFCIVLECVEEKLAQEITQNLSIPTIGIGSGTETDGQVLVINDLLHLGKNTPPKFCKPIAHLYETKKQLIEEYLK